MTTTPTPTATPPPTVIGTHVEAPGVEDRAALGIARVALDIWLLAQRNLLKIWRNKRLILFSTVQPIMQLVLFVFVFGAIANLGKIGISYKDFVVPAVIIQTVVFTGVTRMRSTTPLRYSWMRLNPAKRLPNMPSWTSRAGTSTW